MYFLYLYFFYYSKEPLASTVLCPPEGPWTPVWKP